MKYDRGSPASTSFFFLFFFLLSIFILTCCVVFSRYVLDSQLVERFVQFIGMKGQSAAELFEHSISTFLEQHQIKLSECRPIT